MQRLVSLLGCSFCLLSGPAATATALSRDSITDRPWNREVLYFAITDRFLDGDPDNNIPAGSDPTLYDPTQTDIHRYHGGDFRGLELALEDGYFNDLGITAIWITPPVRNVWHSAFDEDDTAKTGYHGYWTQDFLDIDPHLTSRHSLDGTREYPDTRDGRMQHYKDLVSLAHSRGIRIIQDIVCNHAGPVFYYDSNDNNQLDPKLKPEWVPPFNADSPHPNPQWNNTPRWNQHQTSPSGKLTILNQEIPTTGTLAELESYGRRGMSPNSLKASDGEEIECDFFGLRDIDTAPGTAHFDALVREFIEIYAFYVETIGVDGFRIDTVKHVHHEFWDAFTAGLRERLSPEQAEGLILFGEIYDGNPRALGQYTYRSDWPHNTSPCLDSVLNFQFCFTLRAYLRTNDSTLGNAKKLETALKSPFATPLTGVQRPYYNQSPGLDGLNSSQKIVNFFENHDGLNRFRSKEVSAEHNRLANALTLTLPGIPCLYYGTEVDLHDTDGRLGENGETGRLTYIPAGKVSHFAKALKHPTFQTISALAKLRAQFPALTSGTVNPLWVDGDGSTADDGVFAFAYTSKGMETVVIVMNASNRKRTAGTKSNPMRLVAADGTPLLGPDAHLTPIPLEGNAPSFPPPIHVSETTERFPPPSTLTPTWTDSIPEVQIPIAPHRLDLYRISR